MRAQRGSGEHRLEGALRAVTRALSSTSAPWMVIGGIAVISRGVRRLTTDVDIAVRGDAIGIDDLLRALARVKIAPRIERARTFAEQNLVLLLRHTPTGVDLDLSLAWSGFEHVALAGASTTRFGRVEAPMASPEDLVVFKMIAARPRDLEDAEALLLLHDRIDLRRVRHHLRELAELVGDESVVPALERTVRRVRLARRPTKKRTAKKRR